MNPEDRPIVSGEIIRLDGGKAIVRLDDGRTGTAEIPTETSHRVPLTVGERGRFEAGSSTPDGNVELKLAPVAPPKSAEPTEDDTRLIHNALTHHRITTNGWETPGDPVGEKQIEAWISRVAHALKRIRRHRSKRLDDHF